MMHTQDAEFFSSFFFSLLPSPPFFPLLSSFSLPFLPSSIAFFLSASCCLIIMRKVARSPVKTWRVSLWGSLSSGPPFPCKPSRGCLLFTPAGWTLHCLSPCFHSHLPPQHSQAVITPVSTCCLRWLCFLFFVFIAAQAYLQFRAGVGGHFSCGMWASHCGRILYCRHDLSCSKACGIPLNQGSNSFLPHWQADSLPLSHQGRPLPGFFCPSQLSPHILQGLIHVPFSMRSCLMTPANINLILSWLSLLLTLKSRIEIVAVLGPLSWRFLGYLWAKGLLVITMRMI